MATLKELFDKHGSVWLALKDPHIKIFRLWATKDGSVGNIFSYSHCSFLSVEGYVDADIKLLWSETEFEE